MNTEITLSTIQSLVDGNLENPGSLLGSHAINYRGREARAIRTLQPEAQSMWVIETETGERRPMRRLHPGGFFEAILENSRSQQYRMQMIDKQGNEIETTEPYTTPSVLTDFDRYLLGEGRHFDMYNRLGAHVRVVDGVAGTNFAVWAPNARAVQVVGDFNGWDGRRHAAQVHPNLGIWEIFVPGASVGEKY
ncbi:MAG: 1,4-alpha-glucan branching enzyme, partial [Planctomycetota bacterium]